VKLKIAYLSSGPEPATFQLAAYFEVSTEVTVNNAFFLVLTPFN
jgi:hypothetical protein